MKRVAAILGAVSIVLASCSERGDRLLIGTVSEHDFWSGRSHDGQSCSMDPATREVTVLDGHGKIIATATASEPKVAMGDCVAEFSVRLRIADFYQFRLGSIDDTVRYSKRELDDRGWTIGLRVR